MIIPKAERESHLTPTVENSLSPWRAWIYLIWLSWQRQARARLMVWIALGLLLLFVFLVGFWQITGRLSMAGWRWPRRGGPKYSELLDSMQQTGFLPLDPAATALHQVASGSFHAVLYHGSGFFVFSNILFSIFTTFLLPLWSLSFATEGLGREREAGNLIWLLTRPIPRWAMYLAKYFALLPWCLVLNLGGFFLICIAAGPPGQLAFQVYWPAVFWGTLAFTSLFHLLGAWFRRAAFLAILYAFFLETIMGNLPGHFKRMSISFYVRCLMFDHAHAYGIQPERPWIYLPVSGSIALAVLAGLTVVLLLVGMWGFSRKEYVGAG